MKVKRLELYRVTIPLPKPFYPSWIPGYPQTENRFTLLRVLTDDGIEGFSAGVEMEEERQGLGTLLGPYLIDMDPLDIESIQQRLREASYLGWRNSWIEAAFWDIKGKAAGKPVYELLGGKGGRIPVYCSTGEIHDPARRAEEAKVIKKAGYRGIKLRVHSFDPKDDVAVLESVRKAVGDDMDIMVDANQGWRVTVIEDAPLWNLERAIHFARECERLRIRWIEEPLDMYGYDDLATLCKESSVAIAGGELNAGWHEFKIMLEKGSYDIYQPDATFAGGIATCKRLMDAALAEGLNYTPHTWTNGIGFMINLQIAATHPNPLPLEYPYEPPGWIPEVRDALFKEPLRPDSEGNLLIPNRPGLGFDIDPWRLARYGRKFFTVTPLRLGLHVLRRKGIRTTLELGRRKMGKKKGSAVIPPQADQPSAKKPVS